MSTDKTLWQIVYTSESTRLMLEPDLEDLLFTARHNNAARGLTGLLLYGDETFLQVLEGERSTVEAVFERISRDPRHRRVVSRFAGPVAARSFAGWQMAFRRTHRAEMEDIPGFSEFMERGAGAGDLAGSPAALLDALLRFRAEHAA